MITASVKTTRTKVIGTLCVIVSLIIALILFFCGGKAGNAAESVSRRVSDNFERTEYLAEKGVKTALEPISVEEVFLPEKPDVILSEYNEMQKKAGFDLSPYYGKTVKKYVYPVSEKEETYATIYIYNEMIIAADVASYIEGTQRPIDGMKNMG